MWCRPSKSHWEFCLKAVDRNWSLQRTSAIKLLVCFKASEYCAEKKHQKDSDWKTVLVWLVCKDLGQKKYPVKRYKNVAGKWFWTRLFNRYVVILASPADGDPGFVLRRGHQLRSDLGHLPLQPLELQLPRQRAEQDGGDGVSEPDGDRIRWRQSEGLV